MIKTICRLGALGFVGALTLTLNACSDPAASDVSSDQDASRYEEFQLVTILPKDAIRSIDNPRFYSPDEADREYTSGEMVIGVEVGGSARAYSVDLLANREIVNDVVGGVAIAVTW